LTEANDHLKQQAAVYTIDHYVQSGMVLGLGVGSTAFHAIRYLGQKLKNGDLRDIIGVPAAERTASLAREVGIPLTTLEEHPRLDLTFDGADEVDPDLNLIKGGGGALLREKVIAQASESEIIMVDPSKLVPLLGTNWAVPVEVIDFGIGTHQAFLRSLGGDPALRLKDDGKPFRTDHGNVILDTNFGQINNPTQLAAQMKSHAGIVEHGMFLGLTTRVVVADPNGIRILERESS
jgi:ribose 5-phosphate isomerase A